MLEMLIMSGHLFTCQGADSFGLDSLLAIKTTRFSVWVSFGWYQSLGITDLCCRRSKWSGMLHHVDW